MLEAIPKFLEYGFIGFAAFLALCLFYLVRDEQKQEHPRASMIKIIRLFALVSMVFAVLSIFSAMSDNAASSYLAHLEAQNKGLDETMANLKAEIDEIRSISMNCKNRCNNSPPKPKQNSLIDADAQIAQTPVVDTTVKPHGADMTVEPPSGYAYYGWDDADYWDTRNFDIRDGSKDRLPTVGDIVVARKVVPVRNRYIKFKIFRGRYVNGPQTGSIATEQAIRIGEVKTIGFGKVWVRYCEVSLPQCNF